MPSPARRREGTASSDILGATAVGRATRQSLLAEQTPALADLRARGAEGAKAWAAATKARQIKATRVCIVSSSETRQFPTLKSPLNTVRVRICFFIFIVEPSIFIWCFRNMFRRTTWLAALLVMLMGIVDGESHGEVAVEVVDTTLEYKSMEAGSVIDL